jgi:DNA-binding transcriptional regulator YiaG
MAVNRNNHVFKGHKTLLGSKYVTYGEIELPTRYELYPKSKDGFDWGNRGSGSLQLAFSMLCQLGTNEFAKEFSTKFANEIVSKFNSRDWIFNAIDVLEWIDQYSEKIEIIQENAHKENLVKSIKSKKQNIVKKICKELGITQKNLAEVLEVPEGTVSSWAVKNEIPRLGKKAIEFYMLNKKNQEIVDSYNNFTKLLNTSA